MTAKKKDNLVIFFGAGASVDAGVPVMNDFVDTMYQLFAGVEKYKPVFDVINDFRRVYANSFLDLNNIESLFSAFEMRKLILNNNNDQAYALLRELIVLTVQHTTKYSSNGKPWANLAYYTFIEKAYRVNGSSSNLPITFITTNYDLALDVSIRNREMEIDYGFSEYNLSINERVRLLKLHGSINWFEESSTDNNNSQLSSWDVKDEIMGSNNKLTANSHDSWHHIHTNPNTPAYIIPPSFSKSFENSSLKNVWKNAANALKAADTIIFVGYSVPETDLMTRYLFALGTLENPRIKKIMVINPSENIRDTYNAFLGTYSRVKTEFVFQKFASAIYSSNNDDISKDGRLHNFFQDYLR